MYRQRYSRRFSKKTYCGGENGVLLTEFNEERDYRIVAEGLAENIVEERLEKIEKKAREDEKKTMIKTMLSNGLPKEDIIKFTGISEEELNKIINS